MPTVKIGLENLAEDAVVEVPYLGYFKNNTTSEVDQDKWDRFVNYNPVGATFAEGEDTFELTTQKQNELSEQHAERLRVMADAGGDAEALEDENKKDELISLAESMNIETEGKNKDQLAEEIASAHRTQEPQSFSSVNRAVEDDEQEDA